MKTVKRRIRKHYGVTAKQLAVRSARPWYYKVTLAFLFSVLGFGLAYILLRSNDYDTVSQQLAKKSLKNTDLEAKLIQAQRDLQIELATNNNLAKELANVQDENLKVKEDLFFYKKMLDKE